MKLKQIISDWLDRQKLECTECENQRVRGEGVCYGYTETGNQTLEQAKQTIDDLINCIHGELMEELPNKLHEYAQFILLNKDSTPEMRRNKKLQIIDELLTFLS